MFTRTLTMNPDIREKPAWVYNCQLFLHNWCPTDECAFGSIYEHKWMHHFTHSEHSTAF